LARLSEDLEVKKNKVGPNGVGDVEVNIATFQKKINSQSEFETMSLLDLGFCVELEALEDNHKIVERIESIVRMCVAQIDSSFEVFWQAQPQPCMGLLVFRS